MFRTWICLDRIASPDDHPAVEIGVNRRGVERAWFVKPHARWTAPAIPTQAPPASHSVGQMSIDDWHSWWPSPPPDAPAAYRIPDPPRTPNPFALAGVTPALVPIVWSVAGEVGGNASAWSSPRVETVFVRCQWLPTTGSEAIRGDVELAEKTAKAKIRRSVVDGIGQLNPKQWKVIKVGERPGASEAYDLEAVIDSIRIDGFAFKELILRLAI